MLLVCACAARQPPPPPVVETIPPPRRHHVVPRPARKPAPPPEVALVAPGAGPAAAGAEHDTLIGLDQSEAVRLLGAASETRDDPPATVWRYKSAMCELDLYFYLDLRSGVMRTLHYAFKGDAGDTAKRQACVQAIIAARSS